MDNQLEHLKVIRLILSFAALLTLLLWESWRPFFAFFAAKSRERLQHIARNLSVGLLNVLLVALIFWALWGKSATWSDQGGYGLLHRVGMPLWLHAGLAVLLLDIWTYWWHRANHRLAFLWRFHRLHHSDPSMDVSTARRFHPGEIAISSILRVPLIALFGIYLWELVLYELLAALVIDFHHANVGLRPGIDRFMRLALVTPAMHKVHHSRLKKESDSNYTSLLSLWDRVFRSFRLRSDPAEIRIGLDDWSDAPNQTLPGMLTTPLNAREKDSSNFR